MTYTPAPINKEYPDSKKYHVAPSGTHYDAGTPLQVVNELERYRTAPYKPRLRLFFGVTEANAVLITLKNVESFSALIMPCEV